MNEVTHHPHPGAGITVPFLVFAALLLALLVPDVLLRKPTMTADIRAGWVMHHQAVQNIIYAKTMIVARLDSPTTGWSGYQFGEVGRGVWSVQGAVSTVKEPARTPWKVLFIPGDAEPLYLRVGAHEEGNYAAALMRAGTTPGAQ
jgi:hypothetical protein